MNEKQNPKTNQVTNSLFRNKENTMDDIDYKLINLEKKIELFKKIDVLKERKSVSNLERLFIKQSEDTLQQLRQEIDRLKQKRIHLSEYQGNSPGSSGSKGEYDFIQSGTKF